MRLRNCLPLILSLALVANIRARDTPVSPSTTRENTPPATPGPQKPSPGTEFSGAHQTQIFVKYNVPAFDAYKHFAKKLPCYDWLVLATPAGGFSASSSKRSTIPKSCPTGSTDGGIAVQKTSTPDGKSADLYIIWNFPKPASKPSASADNCLTAAAKPCASPAGATKKLSVLADCILDDLKGRAVVVTLEPDEHMGYSRATIGNSASIISVPVQGGHPELTVIGLR